MARPKELMHLSSNEVQEFLDSFDKVFVDCDGVIWLGYKAIENVPETIKWLKKNGKQVVVVTNNSTIGMESIRALFTRMGLDVFETNIIFPSKVIAWYLKRIQFKDEAYVISGTAFRKLLISEGIRLSKPGPDIIEENAEMVLQIVREKPAVKAVIFDFDVNCNWIKLHIASELLKNENMLFITGSTEKFISLSSDILMMGQEPLCNILINQSKRQPIKCGKPSNVLKDYIFSTFNITKPERCIFIGDSLTSDIEFGSLCDFKTLFIGSGVNNLSQIGKISNTIPDYYLPSLGHLLPLLKQIESQR